MHPTRVIAVTNRKGGTGKTTTAVNGGAALAELGHRVLVIDLDPQLSATRWLGGPVDERGLYDLRTCETASVGALASLAVPTRIDGVRLVPGSRYLTGVERALAGRWTGPESMLRRAVETGKHAAAGRAATASNGRARWHPAGTNAEWDVVLLDCPPTLGLVAVSALVSGREVLVPVERASWHSMGWQHC